MSNIIKYRISLINTFWIATLLFCVHSPVNAFEHETSPVYFRDYSPESLVAAKKENKPVFILISAEWCHWCKVFSEKSLTDEKVFAYLNRFFINLFIDADLRRDLSLKFGANRLPYIVLMRPDESIYYKFGGTLYAEDLLSFLKETNDVIKRGDNPLVNPNKERGFNEKTYQPPIKYDKKATKRLKNYYMEVVYENIDHEEFGVGMSRKLILPETFLYLLDQKNSIPTDIDGAKAVSNTMKKSVQKIFDQVEGGFFRYAETQKWEIPHYEKMVDLNAAAFLLLHKLDGNQNNELFEKAARKTGEYLSLKLYEPGVGSFLSFQAADENYYKMNKEERSSAKEPKIINKIFTDRLSRALIYLIDALEYINDNAFMKKVKRSVDFLHAMSIQNIYHFYSVPKKEWSVHGNLADYVFLSYLFMRASEVFEEPEYEKSVLKIANLLMKKFYDSNRNIFIDKLPGANRDMEYLLELNGIVSLTWLKLSKDSPREDMLDAINNVIKFFSKVEPLLQESVWSKQNFNFLDRYVPYLRAVELYNNR
jgi:uncharacterized protein YyaL (SSP411 family)|tara:strand:- start:1931 stop:3541 length:1611 start_codon:yes stop_codon:yes gene_type:complete